MMRPLNKILLLNQILSIFKQHGRHAGKCEEVWLDDKEYHVAHTYIFLNCPEVAPFVR